MANQTITSPIGLIEDLKIHIPRIPYITTFTIMKNNVLHFSYSMLLNRPWLSNVRIIHDWGNNLITIEGNGIVRTIAITIHLSSNTKCHQVLMCYDLMGRSHIRRKRNILHNRTKFIYTLDYHIIRMENSQCYNIWCSSYNKRPYVQLSTLEGIDSGRYYTCTY